MVVSTIAYLVVLAAIYCRKPHPLAVYPGPALAAWSRIPWWFHAIRGNQISWIAGLHEKYGSVVRYSPNDLSYIDHGGEAWKAIHSRVQGTQEFAKAEEWFVKTYSGTTPNRNTA